MPNRKEHREKYWDDRDKRSYTCPLCDRGQDAVKQFEVHHKDGDPTNGDEDNLVALCRECHHEQHGPWTFRYTKQYQRERDRQILSRVA